MITQDLGIATAYGYAKSKGYTGTEVEFAELMASYAEVGQTAVDAAETATTKASEASASASTAQTAATTAINKATEATTAATTATTKADEASTSASTATSAKDTAVSAASTATSKATEATTAAGTATTAKNDAVAAKTAAETAQTAAETAQEAAEDAAESVSASAAQIQTNKEDISELKSDLTTKANIDGYYEDLVSGGSTQLLSDMVETDTTPYNYRTAGGPLEIGDRMRVREFVGVSLPINQLVDKSTYSTTTTNGVSFTVNSDGTVTVSGKASANTEFVVVSSKSWPAHKYYLGGCPNGGNIATYSLRMIGAGSDTLDVGGGAIWNASGNAWKGARIFIKSGTAFNTAITYKPQFIDLTLLLGTTIADYVYTLESGTEGAGVAWLKKYFPKIFDAGYIPYNAGSMEHVTGLSASKTVGFNQWDEEWELGGISDSTGANFNSTSAIRCINYIPAIPDTPYFYSCATSGLKFRICYYNAEKEFISSLAQTNMNNVYATPSNCHYIRFAMRDTYGTTYNHDICINLHWDGERDGEYEPYEEHVYALPSDETYRGILKIDANGVPYADGDRKLPDGTINRRYGVVDLGTLNWAYFNIEGHKRFGAPFSLKHFSRNLICTKYQDVGYSAVFNNTAEGISIHTDGSQVAVYDTAYTDAADFKTAMSGVYLVYELATPTTEEGTPYTEEQITNNWGTEELVSTTLVPVGHVTDYHPDLRAKVEVAPESPDTDGLYLMKRENGENSYVAYLGELPSDPTTDGTYTLKCTVASGVATKTWEADT